MGVIIAQNADPDNGLSHLTCLTAHEVAGLALRYPWAGTALPHRPMLQRSLGRFAGNHTIRLSGFVIILVALTSRFRLLIMRAATRTGARTRLFTGAPAQTHLLRSRLLVAVIFVALAARINILLVLAALGATGWLTGAGWLVRLLLVRLLVARLRFARLLAAFVVAV